MYSSDPGRSSGIVGPAVIAVADDIVDLHVVSNELPERWAGSVRLNSGPLVGRGIVALLAGPGTVVSGITMGLLPDLRVIVVTSMGWDHVDTDAARSRGVVVVGVEAYCTDEVAEHTVALLLDLLRGVTWLDATVRAGRWDYARAGRPVRGSALGLIGLGRIGAAVAWRAHGLGMTVSAYDPVLDPRTNDLPDVRRVASLEALVSSSDAVSVHVPLSPATIRLVNKDLLACFRKGSYFVNVSRGEVVTEAALGEALREGRLAGAALDVLVHEPPRYDDPILGFPHTLFTPHSAWYSPAAIDRLSRSAGRALVGALAGMDAVS